MREIIEMLNIWFCQKIEKLQLEKTSDILW